jgi:hypothetical protein
MKRLVVSAAGPSIRAADLLVTTTSERRDSSGRPAERLLANKNAVHDSPSRT